MEIMTEGIRENMYSFFFFVVFLIKLTLAGVGLVACNIKPDCPEGYFCHEETCKKCLKCDVVFRKGNFCVVDFNDCEDCLEGYEEVLVTHFSSVIKPCKPVKKKVKLKKCENDQSCPQDNYCSEESCVKCFDCSLVNRLPPVEKCAKGLNECGSCMTGFTEVAVTTETNYKPCETVIPVVSEVTNSYKSAFIGVVPVSFFFALIALAGFILLRRQYKDCERVKTIYRNPICPSAPPLYPMDAPQYIKKAEDTESTVVGFVREKKQQAKVFKQPDASYYYIGEDTNQLDGAPLANNEGAGPNSNSAESEENNCSSGILLNRYSQLSVNESITYYPVLQPNENSAERNVSPSMNSIVLNIIDTPQISENSTDEANNNLPGTQSSNEEQMQ